VAQRVVGADDPVLERPQLPLGQRSSDLAFDMLPVRGVDPLEQELDRRHERPILRES
jgi:hypothetical protein